MTVDEFNEAAKEVSVLRAEVVEARSKLQEGTVEQKREAREVLQSARAALSKAETVVAKVATMSDFQFEIGYGVVMTADAGQITAWIDANKDFDRWEMCNPDRWKVPPEEPLKPTTLAKVKWGEWRR